MKNFRNRIRRYLYKKLFTSEDIFGWANEEVKILTDIITAHEKYLEGRQELLISAHKKLTAAEKLFKEKGSPEHLQEDLETAKSRYKELKDELKKNFKTLEKAKNILKNP